jgi:hypothetical protein
MVMVYIVINSDERMARYINFKLPVYKRQQLLTGNWAHVFIGRKKLMGI